MKINVQPRVNIYSNYTGKPYIYKEKQIREAIVKQVCSPVKWEQIQQLLHAKRQVIVMLALLIFERIEIFNCVMLTFFLEYLFPEAGYLSQQGFQPFTDSYIFELNFRTSSFQHSWNWDQEIN